MTKAIASAVLAVLGSRRQGSSAAIIANELECSRSRVEDALDALCEAGKVRIVRRTKTSITYGLTREQPGDTDQ